MKVQVAILMCGLSTVASGCAQTDARITTSVEAALATDDLVKGREIDVDTKAGMVTLNGTVETPQEETKALEIARRTDGVAGVIDNISVGRTADQPAPTTGRYGETPEVSSRLNLDPGLTVEVKTKLLTDPTVSGLAIDVDTRDRVVTLTGTVGSQAEKQRALDIARRVENVLRVEDKLIVDRESR